MTTKTKFENKKKKKQKQMSKLSNTLRCVMVCLCWKISRKQLNSS